MSLKGLSEKRRDELKDKMLEFRQEAETGNRPDFRRMTLAERFKIGKHWRNKDIEHNESFGKFAITVNEVLPIVLQIAGVEEQNPTDATIRNVKNGTQVIADVLTSLVKRVFDENHGDKIKSQVFEQGNSVCRSFMHWDIDYSNDPENGNFVLRETDPFMVLPQPKIRVYDYNSPRNGAKYIIIDDWQDRDRVEKTYPGEADKIKQANLNILPTQGRSGHLISMMFGGFNNRVGTRDDYRDAHFDEEAVLTSKEKTNHRVSTYFWKEWKKGVYVKRVDDPLSFIALTKAKDIRQAKELAEDNDNLQVIEKDRDGQPLVVPVLNKTMMVGDVLVDHIEDPFNGMFLFPIVRFAPYFDSGYEYCVVENLIGPQKIINMASSTLINLVKNVANGGWFVGKATKKLKQWLATHGVEDGIVIDKTDFGGFVEKIPATDYPVGVDTLAERMKGNMRDTSQVELVNPKPRGESGKAKQIDELQSLRTMGVIFRNWKYTNVLLVQVLVELIRNTNVFSDEEILEIVEDDGLIDDQMLGEARQVVAQAFGIELPEPPTPPDPALLQQMEPETASLVAGQFQQEQEVFAQLIAAIDQEAIPIAQARMLDSIRDMQRGRYGIKVDISPSSPTRRLAKQAEAFLLNTALIEGGHKGVSREQLIKTTDLDNKEEAIAGVA